MNLRELNSKKILILGFGKEGKDTLSFLRKNFPKKRLGVADQKEKEIKNKEDLDLYFGKKYLESISKYDIVFKTAGVPLKKVKKYLSSGAEITSQDKFFLENCPGTIVGVTGTKGKGTTVSLIYNILKKAGKKVYLVGNIGEPRLAHLEDSTPEDIFIQEFSARQLQIVERSPHIAVFLNLYEAHLDFYKDFEEYKKAKQRIALFQTENDYFVYNKDQKETAEMAKKTRAQKISFSLEQKADCFLENEKIFWKDEKIMEASCMPLPGRFNLENTLAAVCVSKLLGTSNEIIKKGVEEFRSMPHRLERVGEYRGIVFYNDSLATLPEPVMFALDTFGNKVQSIILGGHEAGQKFETLVQKILTLGIKNIILFPPVGKRIKKLLENKSNEISIFETESMKEAVNICFKNTKKGKICLLSPAAPSFGIFKDYRERGELFRKWIKHYAKKTTN